MIPIYRAKKIDSDEYAYGYLVMADDYDTDEDEDQRVYFIMHKMENYRTNEVWDFVCNSRIDATTLEISFDNRKSFIKLSDLEIHTCTDFELNYTNMKMRDCKEVQPPNGSIFTIITDKGR